ncbi:MAG: HAMP domain-containing histidine kinase, partial [Acidobacteriota bacterium]|nr:HAMP domain-containing histidine kinase [Acidobacteriota bacterium]
DGSLRTQAGEWEQFTARSSLSTPASLTLAAHRFLASQRYHAESLVTVVQVVGGPTLSSSTELLASDESAGAGAALLAAPPGLSDRMVLGAGAMRVLSEPILAGGRRVGTLRVADPLRPVSNAQSSLRQAFALVGALTLIAAILAGAGLAFLIAAPLRRITAVADAAAAGDLSVRAGPAKGRDEVAVLARGFDQMLARLERAFSRQKQFVSDASHELRTPLAVARAQTELLDRERDPDRRHESTVMLLRRLDELDRLIADMLTLAGAEGGHLIEPATFELHGFFEDVRRELPLFGDRDYRVQAVDGSMLADAGRLTQVVRNLVRNAVTHTHPGDSVEIEASAHGDRLQIAVIDSGPGIPSDQLEQIFERFHRVERSRSRDRGGTGLGLPIARAIVEAHGGWIRAESSPGHGATIRFELPGYTPPPRWAAAGDVVAGGHRHMR